MSLKQKKQNQRHYAIAEIHLLSTVAASANWARPMHTQTNLDSSTETEVRAPLYFGVPIDRSFFVTTRSLASNDASCDDQTPLVNQIDARARHASAENGFADAASVVPGSASFDLQRVARKHRAFVIGTTILIAISAVWALLHRGYTYFGDQQADNVLRDGLHRLNDHALRDLGLHRSEIDCLTAQTSGRRHTHA